MQVIKLAILGIVFFSSCSDEKEIKNDSKENHSTFVEENKKNTDTLGVENFDLFIEKFSNDSEFQVSRINFPLNVETYDIDDESYEKSTIKKSEWKFFDLKNLDEKKIRKINRDVDNNYILNIQIMDTGVFVDYIFKSKNNEWILIKIVDKST